MWDSINVSLDPELKEKLFRAEINLFECESCGEKNHIDAPLLYHDMELQFCVQYCPSEELGDPEFLAQFLDLRLLGLCIVLCNSAPAYKHNSANDHSQHS